MGLFCSGQGNVPEGWTQATPDVVPEGWDKETWTTFCTALRHGADFQELAASLDHLIKGKVQAQGVLVQLGNDANDLNIRKKRVNISATLKDMNNQRFHIGQLREQAEARLSFATSYSQDMILRCHAKALEDKWVDIRGPNNDIISRCINHPGGSTALQQISFAQKQKM